MKQQFFRTLALLSWIQIAGNFGASAGQSFSNPAASARIDFSRDVQPIFVERCYGCHGPEKQKGGLRLDSKERAFTGGDSGKVLVPGESGESLLYRYVAGLHPEIRMPPKGEPLTRSQITLLRSWIDAGAPWEESAHHASRSELHWSFRKPERPTIPKVKNTRWVRNAIDAFGANLLR